MRKQISYKSKEENNRQGFSISFYLPIKIKMTINEEELKKKVEELKEGIKNSAKDLNILEKDEDVQNFRRDVHSLIDCFSKEAKKIHEEELMDKKQKVKEILDGAGFTIGHLLVN